MNQNFEITGFLYGMNASFIEELYQLYKTKPELLDEEWKVFFKNNTPLSDVTFKTSSKVILGEEKPLPVKASANITNFAANTNQVVKIV